MTGESENRPLPRSGDLSGREGASQIVVMGVSGCGKSTVGERLAAVLGCRFVDGDDLHPSENKAKMASGVPLEDSDRWPWLESVGRCLAGADADGMVIACSALRRAYRDRIRQSAANAIFVHLDGPRDLLLERLSERKGHFFKAELLDSQLETLEPLEDDEAGLVVGIERPAEALVDALVESGLRGRNESGRGIE